MTGGNNKADVESSTREISPFGDPSQRESGQQYEDDRDTETTRLLGTGTRSSGPSGEHGVKLDDRWMGLDDFEGFPWWKKPSVRRCPVQHFPLSWALV